MDLYVPKLKVASWRFLPADAMSDGIGSDGSLIRGFQEIQESDMLVVPDPTHAHQLIEQRLSPFLVYARYGPDDS